ncbi:DEAD/DEAH box helicase [Phocicoccus pinnipedialis]|nr:DEAD/DEAH box helicase [Jeotgalicoccus pinnipedialis]MBP1939997.1 SNF2 family DNA or RNA helicase [Jeotgalicoccus pinnipedialis]
MDVKTQTFKTKQMKRNIENFLKNISEGNMKDSLKKLQAKRAENDIEVIPVDVLNKGDDELVSNLRQHNIFNIGDLKRFDAQSLGVVLNNIAPETVEKLIKDKDILMRDITINTFPKIDPDNLSKDSLVLLKHWYFNTTYKRDVEILESETVTDQAEALLGEMKKKRGVFLSLFQSSSQKEQINDAFSKFEQIEPELNEIHEIVDKLLLEFQDEKYVRDAFINDSAAFYAFIESRTGVAPTVHSGDLPAILVEEITDMELDVSGLTGGTLRPYQLFGTKFAVYNKRTLIGDEMGLGKTIQALGVITHLFTAQKTRAFVICPKSVMANWAHEIEKWTEIPVKIFHGSKRDEAYKEWLETPSILITNPEHTKNLDIDTLDYVDCLIIDEAHLIKNPKTQRTQNAMAIAAKSEYVMMMTGTPIENNVNEMKHLIGILQPHIIEEMERNPRMNEPEAFKTLVSPAYLRRKRFDVLKELPEIDFIEKFSEMSEKERSYYNDGVREGLSGLMKMRRAAFTGNNINDSEKLANIVEICTEAKENGHKVLIFSFFKDNLNLIHETLGPQSAGIISGDVGMDERQGMIDAFTTREAGATLIGQIDAAGVGLNIQAANIVILCEPQWKPSTELQAIGRAYRMGQTRNVIVYRLLSEKSIDEAITEVRDEKLKSFNLYANDSSVADVFKAQEVEINEAEVQKEAFEIEKKRLEEQPA